MTTTRRTAQIDATAFGVIYGTIMVLALVISAHPPVEAPGRFAVVLFASVFAVALAKAYAELCERMLETGQPARSEDFRDVWHHARTVLLAANGPALAFLLASAGLITGEAAQLAAQVVALAALGVYGARIGWRVRGTVLSAVLGAALTLGIGAGITTLKYLAH